MPLHVIASTDERQTKTIRYKIWFQVLGQVRLITKINAILELGANGMHVHKP